MRLIALPSRAPLIHLRLQFRTGAAFDPPGRPGTAGLTAAMLAEGGTRHRAYPEILDRLFPIAASVQADVDQEMTTFTLTVHEDNLEEGYGLLREMLLEPGWRDEDIERLRDERVRFLEVGLRGNNDEELAKEAMYSRLFAGHPYRHHPAGTVFGLRALSAGDLQDFYTQQFTQENLVIGIAGNFPAGFPERIQQDFAALPATGVTHPPPPPAPEIDRTRVLIVEKVAPAVAISFGHPIDVTRSHPDFVALLVAQSALGQHRMSGGRLYHRMREQRGLNYGDYAYIEHFPGGMFRLQPPANMARTRAVFQVWVRPVAPENAHFALRLALHEVEKLITNGLDAEEFEHTRRFLGKYTNLLLQTKDAELGYALDSDFYGTAPYAALVRDGLASLTVETVNAALRRHLRHDRLHIAIVAPENSPLREQLLSEAGSPITYNSPKPDALLQEDAIVQRRPLSLAPPDITSIPASTLFA